jgi:hypothetical protein
MFINIKKRLQMKVKGDGREKSYGGPQEGR